VLEVETADAATDDAANGTATRARGRPGFWADRLDGALVAIVALGVALRSWRLGGQSLWYDEWLTAEATSGGVRDLVRHIATREGITPPYFAVMWVWARLVGDGEAALRSFSVVVGVATVPLAYAIARELGQQRRVARAVALLVAVNPMLVWYSQEARPYSLLAFVGAATLLATVRVDRWGRNCDVMAWGLVAAGAVAVHYFAVFLVVGEGVALLVRRRLPLRRLAVAVAPVAAVLLALAPVALEQHSHATNREWISQFPLTARIEEAGRSALVGPSPARAWQWMVPALALVVGAAFAARKLAGRDRRIVAALLALAAAAVALPLLPGLVGTDVFLGRYVLAAAVPLAVGLAVLLLSAPRARVGGAALLIVVAAWIVADIAVAADPRLHRSDWRSVAEVADGGSARRVLVVDTNGGQSSPLHRYLDGVGILEGEQTVLVDQIDVLVARPAGVPCNFLVGRACGFVFLGGPLPDPIAARFQLDERFVLDQFVVERYRADSPVELGRDELLQPDRRAGGHVWLT
jgi:4-amino-4-deoxy-L-arabinose transferase-like glycosyltransferase